MKENKVIFLQDSDLLVSDIKASCIRNIKTLGVNKINHDKGVELILEGTVIPYFHPDEMKEATTEIISRTVQDCLSNFSEEDNVSEVHEYYHTLSMRDNFRKEIDPSYKNKGIKKYNSFMNPEIRQYLIDLIGIYDKNNNPDGKVFVGYNFEADDMMGISATYFYRKYLAEGYNPRIIICAEDKDVFTIPNVYIYNPNTQEFTFNDYLSATKFWLKQILMGDIADNITKTPKGYGFKTAAEVVDKNINQGIKHTYYTIKEIYRKHGIEEQCEINAQLLRILTIDFFDPNKQEAIIFNEGMLDWLDEQFFNELNRVL